MQIRQSDDLWVKKTRAGEVWSNFSGKWMVESEKDRITLALRALKIARSSKISNEKKSKAYDAILEQYKKLMPAEELVKRQTEAVEQKNKVSSMLINFFKDFEFEPSFRFVNTLYWKSNTVDEATNYIFNYFNLSDNQYKDDVAEKMKSHEFADIISEMKKISSSKHVNDRLKLYYGAQGTGKTTDAIKEANNNVVVCNSSMLPSDLLEDFGFDNGKAGFNKSALWLAMEQGKAIVLDEINLLPFESIRFLQGITDGKTQIIYKGQTINIKEGFKIIGTMNLRLGGACYALPEPLIDRAYDLKEYKLTAEQLACAF